jgi:hypothetical protein
MSWPAQSAAEGQGTIHVGLAGIIFGAEYALTQPGTRRRAYVITRRPPRQVCLQAMQFSVLTEMAPQLVSRVSPGLQA